MASDPFFSAVIARRSIHVTSAASPIPDSRINEIVQKAILHVPSTFNVQSARAVILLKEEHIRFWGYAEEMIKANLPEALYERLKGRITLFKAAYGSVSQESFAVYGVLQVRLYDVPIADFPTQVLFFEDQADLSALAKQHESVAPFLDEWSDHSSGMNQFAGMIPLPYYLWNLSMVD